MFQPVAPLGSEPPRTGTVSFLLVSLVLVMVPRL